ncbi:MAG: AMIN domain-containing protein, partial [Zetaproteobacteria bacterium]
MSARLLPLLLLLPVLFGAQPAGAVTVEGLRLWGAPDHTRLVLDMTGRARYKLFRLHRPERVVIDIAHARDRIPAGDLRRRGG